MHSTKRAFLTLIATGALVGCAGGKIGAFLPSSTSDVSTPQHSVTPTPKPTAPPLVVPTTPPIGVPTIPPVSVPSTSATATPTPSGTPIPVQITFYSYFDNNNSTAITYPVSNGFFTVHSTAGGSGTYNDPVTAATSNAVFAVGTRLYIPALLKYVVMESSCAACSQDWTSLGKRDLNIWTGGDQTTLPAAISNCQTNLALGVVASSAGSTAIPNPPNGLTVDTTPLFQAVPPTATGSYSWTCYFP